MKIDRSNVVVNINSTFTCFTFSIQFVCSRAFLFSLSLPSLKYNVMRKAGGISEPSQRRSHANNYDILKQSLFADKPKRIRHTWKSSTSRKLFVLSIIKACNNIWYIWVRELIRLLAEFRRSHEQFSREKNFWSTFVQFHWPKMMGRYVVCNATTNT